MTRLFQLHWQNRVNFQETEFVAQAEFMPGEDPVGWALEVSARRGAEMPAGWMPLLLTEKSPYFVWAVPPERGR